MVLANPQPNLTIFQVRPGHGQGAEAFRCFQWLALVRPLPRPQQTVQAPRSEQRHPKDSSKI